MKNRKNESSMKLKFRNGMNRFNVLLIILVGLLITLGSCHKDIDKHYKDYASGYDNGLWKQITDNPDYSSFVMLVKRVNLETAITENSVLTLWIPTNDACAKLSALSDEALKQVLMFHISIGTATLDMVTDTFKVQTLLGKNLTVVRSKGGYAIGDVQVVKMNAVSKNGVIHQLGNTLSPKPSFMEYLQSGKERYSLIYNYIVKYNKIYNDIKHSVKIGNNAKGQSIYDTVKVRTNKVLKKIGDYYSEEASLTANFAPDKVFLQAMADHVYPYFTSLSGFNTVTDTFFIPKLIDSVLVNNTFLNGVVYSPGKNTLQRSLVDTARIKVAGGLVVPVTYHKDVVVKSESVDSMAYYSNGLGYVFKDLNIPKKWFSYPFGKLAHTYRVKFIDSLSIKTPIVSKGKITMKTKKSNGKLYESYDPVRLEWFEAADSIIEYQVDVLPMRYKLIRECNTFYTGTVQASVSYNNDNVYTPVGDPFDNSVFATNPADNSGLTPLPAGWGRWVQPLTFTKPGVVKIRFTVISGSAVNVHAIYLTPMD